MNQGQAAPPAQPAVAAPPAQPAAAAAPPVLPAPPAPLPVPPAPPAFSLGPGRSHAILNFDDPNTGATATKLYNKAIAPLDAKFDGEADNLAVFLASVRDRARRFNWHRLITVPIDDGTTRNLLTHYGQVSLDNTRTHAVTYVNTPTRDAQDNDMFYYFLADSLTNEFRATVLLYADTYTVTNVPVASTLLKQIVILTRVDNPASTMHIREMLIESKQKLVQLKGNITEFNQWVRKQMGRLHAREQEAVDLLYYLWKAYKAAPDEEFVVYIKDQKKTKETTKKKSQDKWAWKNKPPKDNDNKEDNAFVKSFEGKKYFWCTNHNNGAGMWTLHHPKDCEAGKAPTGTSTKAHIAAFDTVDSDSDME